MAALQVPLSTPEEYLARERSASFKSEYISGEIFAMAGGSPEHNMIAMDVSVALANGFTAENGKCNVHNSDQKVLSMKAVPSSIRMFRRSAATRRSTPMAVCGIRFS
jgi:Uma2 family endonuclease